MQRNTQRVRNTAEVASRRMRNPLDIFPAKKELGWAPKIYLEEGIAGSRRG